MHSLNDDHSQTFWLGDAVCTSHWLADGALAPSGFGDGDPLDRWAPETAPRLSRSARPRRLVARGAPSVAHVWPSTPGAASCLRLSSASRRRSMA